jgi:hypothetical protein
MEYVISVFQIFIVSLIELSKSDPKLGRLTEGLLRIYCCNSLCESLNGQIGAASSLTFFVIGRGELFTELDSV